MRDADVVKARAADPKLADEAQGLGMSISSRDGYDLDYELV